MLYLGDNLKEFLTDINTNTLKSKELCSRVKALMDDTFDDSARRFERTSPTSNQYVFTDKPFSIDCNL